MALGKQIKKQRTARGWTLEHLSDASGVDVGTISALEVRDSARSKYASAIAAAFGLAVEQLEREEVIYQTASDNINTPPMVSEPSVIHIGRRESDEHQAIAEVLKLMQRMDEPGKWILVGMARQLANQHPINKQVSLSQ